jgi:transposase
MYFQKHNDTGSVADKPKTGRRAKLHSAQHDDFVNQKMEETSDLSAKKLQEAIEAEFNIEVSVSTVRVFRRSLGWVSGKMRYCQMIRHVNKEKRVQWCQDQLAADEQFDVSMSELEITLKLLNIAVFKFTIFEYC